MTDKGSFVVDSNLPNGSSSSTSKWFVGPERKSSLSSVDWSKARDMAQNQGDIDSSDDMLSSLLEEHIELKGFSSSLPALLNEKLTISSSVDRSDDLQVELGDAEEPLDQEMISRAIGDILPNDDELLAGLTSGFAKYMTDENEDDLFSSGGGLEMDGESQESFGMYMSRLDGFYGLANFHSPSPTGPGSVVGEHPYGEHPSRTLFVRNINSNVEDAELRSLFEQYGDIRTLYTACKHRGFVMISYYDIRAARSAMRALQNKPLRRRKLDIHFSIPKDNPSDKDINQGTLVVFNLDASVSNEEVRQIFGHYGEVKEIRETPHKRHHKFIEFYDVRAAEGALRALNRSDIAGKRIKLEPSRPGGARRSLMQQLNQDADQDDIRLYRQQSSSPITNSPPGHFSSWGHFGSSLESGSHRPLHHPVGTSVPTNKNLPNLPIPRVGTIGSHLGRSTQHDVGLASLQPGPLGAKGVLSHHAHSLPEYSNAVMPFFNPSTSTAIRVPPNGPENESLRLPRTSSELSLFEHAPGGPGMSNGQGPHSGSVGSASLSGPQFLWGNSSTTFQQDSSPMVWSNSSSMGPNFNHVGHARSQPFGYARNHPHYVNGGFHSHRHHGGSAPSGDPSFLERQFAYVHESPDATFFGPGPTSSMNTAGGGMMSLLGSHSTITSNGFFESGTSPNLSAMPPHRRGPMFPPNGIVIGSPFDMLGDRGRIRRIDNNSVPQVDNKKQFQLDIDRILRGEDNRTTLMIKNIPNKYTSKMLLAAIDENHKGMYDFLYLPIDFKNKCNVGYAFINMTSPEHIIPLYQSFNGKKWEKFNSEKVASLAYARIQGKTALVAHFQNSSLMNEDKRCRPILLNSECSENNEQELIYLEIGTKPLVVGDAAEIIDIQDEGGSNSTLSSNSPDK